MFGSNGGLAAGGVFLRQMAGKTEDEEVARIDEGVEHGQTQEARLDLDSNRTGSAFLVLPDVVAVESLHSGSIEVAQSNTEGKHDRLGILQSKDGPSDKSSSAHYSCGDSRDCAMDGRLQGVRVDNSGGSLLYQHAEQRVLTQSARIESRNQAGFDADVPQVANSPQVEDGKEKAANKRKSESVGIEPLKSSKFGWLIRVRLNSVPGRPAIPISYMSDREYQQLRRSKKRYESFKKSIKAEYKGATWQGDDAGTGSSGT